MRQFFSRGKTFSKHFKSMKNIFGRDILTYFFVPVSSVLDKIRLIRYVIYFYDITLKSWGNLSDNTLFYFEANIFFKTITPSKLKQKFETLEVNKHVKTIFNLFFFIFFC